MSAPILHLSVSQRPVFLLNSRLSLFSAATCVAPLLPKLRGHFAEFLNNTSPVGLWIFSSSTCVGLRYGYVSHNSGFSRQCGFGNFPTFVQSPSHFIIKRRICLLHSYLACTGLSIPGLCSPHVSPQFCLLKVQESQPVVHRLRLSASP